MRKKSYRVNERIRAPQVRVIDPDGEQIGVMPIKEAQEEAMRRSLDLIEIAADADPPVCRIVDFGKFRYQQQKRGRRSAKKVKQSTVKNIRLRPNTGAHDINFKLRKAVEFLENGDKVKFNVIFRGPELRHKEIGRQQLQRFIDGCAEVAEVDVPPRMEGRQMTMLLRPKG